jgi:hypothetical protein
MMTSGGPFGFVSSVVGSSFCPPLLLLGSIVNDFRAVVPTGVGRLICEGGESAAEDVGFDVGIVAPSLETQLGPDCAASTG